MSRRILAAVLLLTACQRTTAVSSPSDAPEASSEQSRGRFSDFRNLRRDTVAESATPSARKFRKTEERPHGAEIRKTEERPHGAEIEPAPQIEIVETEEGSVRLTRFATVHAEPSTDSTTLGVLAAGTRIRSGARFQGEGCGVGWMGLPEGGWICAEVEQDDRPPREAMLPEVPEGRRVPGVYGRLRKGAMIYPDLASAKARVGGRVPEAAYTVRRLSTVRSGGRAFWKTRHGLVEREQVRRFRASSFEGRLVGDAGLQLPIAWTLSGKERRTVPLFAEPSPRAEVLDRLYPHEAFHVEGISEDGRFVDVGEGWVSRDVVRIARHEPAPTAVQDGERWLDIDLDEQTLVAYEGDTPLYATLVSTGKVHHRTPVGVYRIERKVALRTMNSMADSDEQYSVDKVPWTAYFATGYALHTAYWHDGFGRERSHGCINLSPADARRLYGWTAPVVRPNWYEVHGNEDQPGSVIRIRNDRNPHPPLQGYAANMHEQPGAGAGTTGLAAP